MSIWNIIVSEPEGTFVLCQQSPLPLTSSPVFLEVHSYWPAISSFYTLKIENLPSFNGARLCRSPRSPFATCYGFSRKSFLKASSRVNLTIDWPLCNSHPGASVPIGTRTNPRSRWPITVNRSKLPAIGMSRAGHAANWSALSFLTETGPIIHGSKVNRLLFDNLRNFERFFSRPTFLYALRFYSFGDARGDDPLPSAPGGAVAPLEPTKASPSRSDQWARTSAGTFSWPLVC